MSTDLPMHRPAAHDLLACLHKALRCFMFDVLVCVGRVDVSDRGDVQQTAQRVQRLLALVHEPPGTLADGLAQLQRGPVAQRAAAARVLYEALSDWSIGMLQRLAREQARHEARPAPALAEAAAQRQRQLATLSDAELREALQWMGRSLSPQELAALLADLQPAGAARFGLALDALGSSLDADRWDQLARAMNLPQVTLPGPLPAPACEALPLAA